MNANSGSSMQGKLKITLTNYNYYNVIQRNLNISNISLLEILKLLEEPTYRERLIDQIIGIF